ncbi:MAG: hypothetical protein N3J91_06420 [Verrucomicrobiae bacterium]|nr:hypothetical protein [Verrucomicrobiae bacterium]
MKCPACGKSLWFRLPECPHCHAALAGAGRAGRPWTVSLPCWVFFALACLNLAMILLADWAPGNAGWRESFRVKAPFAFYMRYAMPVLMLALVWFMLYGRNWARWVFVVWFGNAFFWQVLKTPKLAWPQAVLFAVSVVLWFLPRSNQFFSPPAPGRAGGAAPAPAAPAGPNPTAP